MTLITFNIQTRFHHSNTGQVQSSDPTVNITLKACDKAHSVYVLSIIQSTRLRNWQKLGLSWTFPVVFQKTCYYFLVCFSSDIWYSGQHTESRSLKLIPYSLNILLNENDLCSYQIEGKTYSTNFLSRFAFKNCSSEKI